MGGMSGLVSRLAARAVLAVVEWRHRVVARRIRQLRRELEIRNGFDLVDVRYDLTALEREVRDLEALILSLRAFLRG